MIPPAEWTPDMDSYHAYPAWGSSMLSDLAENRRLAYARYVTHTEPLPPASGSMKLGTLVHALIESAALGEATRIVVVDCNDRRNKEYKAAQAAAGPGQMVYPKPEIAHAVGIANAILLPKTPGARAARSVLVDHAGVNEYSVKWQHSAHVELKVRFDRLAELEVGVCHADIKTTMEPQPDRFRHSVRKYRYLHALALRDLAAAAIGVEIAAHFLIAVRSEPPFEVCCFQPQMDALVDAHDKLRLELLELEELLQAPDEEAWLAYWEREVVPLTAEEVNG